MPQHTHDTQQKGKSTKQEPPSAMPDQETLGLESPLFPIVLQRAAVDPGRTTPQQIRAMQRVGGNRAVVRLLRAPRPGTIQRDEGDLSNVRFSGTLSRGQSKRTVTSDDVKTTTETSYSELSGTSSEVKNILKAKDNTIEKAILVLAMAGAFSESSGKKSVEDFLGKYVGQGTAKAFVGTTTSAKRGTQTKYKEIVIDGETLRVVESIKYLAEAGVDVGAGASLEGELERTLGPVGIELAGKLEVMAKVGAKVGADVTWDPAALNIAANLVGSVDGKIGFEIGGSGSLSVKFGSVVKLQFKLGLSLFVGAKGNLDAYAKFNLRKFFTLSYANKPSGWKGEKVYDPNRQKYKEKTWESGTAPSSEDVFEQYGLDLGAKGEALAGALGKQTGEVTVKVKDVSFDITDEVEALAGAQAGANARVALSLTEVNLTAKAEAFAGLKAKGKLSGALKYKGRAFITVTGGGSVSLGAGASASVLWRARPGGISFYGSASTTLGLGFGFDIGFDIDFMVVAEAIKDIIAAALGAKARQDKNRSEQSVRFGKYFSEDGPALPTGVTKAAVETKVKKVLEGPFKDYASTKARKGKHGVKKIQIQKIIDSRAVADGELGSYISTKAGDKALKDLAMDIFGKSGVLTNITFKAGTIDTFEIDEGAVARQKNLRGAARGKLQKYKRKKWWFGSHGVKAMNVRFLLDDVIRDNTGYGKASIPLEVLAHELESAAKEILGEDIQVKMTAGPPPRVQEVILHPEKEGEDADEETKQTREMAKSKVLAAFRALDESKLKKGKGWIQKWDLDEILRKKKVDKQLDYDRKDSSHNKAILAGLQEAAEEAFGLGRDKITFKIYGATVFTEKFPRITNLDIQAATLRYVKAQVVKAVNARFQKYAGERSTKRSNRPQQKRIQKIIDKSGVNKHLGDEDRNKVILDTIREKAVEHFGKQHDFQLRVTGGKKKRVELQSIGVVSKPLPPAPNATEEEKAQWERERVLFGEAVKDTRERAQAAVEGLFTAYAEKMMGTGKTWIERDQIQALIDKSAVDRYLVTSGVENTMNIYNSAVIKGIAAAAKKAFGARQKFVFRLSSKGDKVELESIELVAKAAPEATEEEKKASREAVEDTKAKAKAAVLPSFQGYYAKAKQSRGKLVRWFKGDQNWINRDAIQKLIDKSRVTKFLDPASPGDASNAHNQAVLQGIIAAAEETFGQERQTFELHLFMDGEIWLKPIKFVRRETDEGIGDAKGETKAMVRAAMEPRFRAYAKKKGGVKHWKQWMGIVTGYKSKHWIKREGIDRAIDSADLVRYMDPISPYNKRLPLNVATLEAVKEAADEVFPSEMVDMTFKLDSAKVKVDTFQLKDKAILFKVASQLYFYLTQYVESRSGKALIAAKDYVSLKENVVDIISSRIAQDYVDDWPKAVADAIEEVGQHVFKDHWAKIGPIQGPRGR